MPAQPYLLGAAGTIQDTVDQNQGNLQQLAGQAQGYSGQLGEMAFGQQPGLDQGFGFISDTLGGNYLNSNPYIDEMAALAGQSAADRINTTFSTAGRTGGGNHAEGLAKGVAEAENALRYQAYAQERAMQMQALGMLPGMVGSQYAGVLPYATLTQTAGQLPYYGLNALGNIGSLFGGYGTTKGTQPGGWGNDLLNAAASIGSAAIMASDPRLKKNVKKVGQRPDGLGVYEYRYKQTLPKGKQIGVMADEVEALRPDALGPMVNGFRTVDYGRL